jgi:ribose transport system permease protein
MYELYVITAVVVGGTSLSGGDGKILGTLYGALAIAVIRNGMNLMNIESYTQGVVMGVLILVAVFIDSLKRGHVVLWLRRLFIRPT